MKKFLFQEADFYGASNLIFGKKLPLVYKATWMHGLGPPLRNRYPKNIIIHYNETHLPLHLVNNTRTVDELASQDIDAIAVGMPYIYTKVFIEKKRSNTQFKRVYFPRHSIGFSQMEHYERWRIILSKYHCDAICLSDIDYRHLKSSDFYLGDVKLIFGAKANDPKSLERSASTFFSTREIITDTRSSHLAYAAASGVQVRVIDEINENYNSIPASDYVPKKFEKDFQYQKEPEKEYEKIMSSVYVKGNDAEMREYSEYILGIDSRKSIDQMKHYLTPNNIIQAMKISTLLVKNKFYTKIGI